MHKNNHLPVNSNDDEWANLAMNVKNSFLHFDENEGDSSAPQVRGRSRFFSDMTDLETAKGRKGSTQLTTDEESASLGAVLEEPNEEQFASRKNSVKSVKRDSLTKRGSARGSVSSAVSGPKVAASPGRVVYVSGSHPEQFDFMVPQGYTLIPTPLYEELLARAHHPTPQMAPRHSHLEQEADKKKRAANKKGKKDVDDADCTTMMLRNIPNKLTQSGILEYICKAGFRDQYNFFYLPMDFANMCNVGYAFINFYAPRDAQRFKQKFQDLKMSGFNSTKVCQVCYARVQGFQANIDHYRNSPVMNLEDDEMKPVVIKGGRVVPFPKPEGPLPGIRYRSHRHTTRRVAKK